MDDTDRAQANTERFITLAIQRTRMPCEEKTERAFFCTECGDAIPHTRRLAVPGVSHCLECATWFEQHRRRI